MSRIVIVSDAWEPQINGVVTTMKHMVFGLRQQGYEVLVIEPNQFKTVPCPSYAEIPLVLNSWKVPKKIKEFNPDFIHIATEGPLGFAARIFCSLTGREFTTSFHTNFPEYISARSSLSEKHIYRFMRWFHSKSSNVLVTTETMRKKLASHRFKNLVVWGRGVDCDLFTPEKRSVDLEQPVYLYVGRISVEKNLEAFLSIPLNGTKLIVGDGPDLPMLQEKYSDAIFVGAKSGTELARYYASSDVFVFPSLTDTFGVVMLEAMASGLPVAAYPVTGPKDVIIQGITGSMDDDLSVAIEQAKSLESEKCVEYARSQSWNQCVLTFESYLKKT